ncbi:MAG: hypothetical protein GX801_08120 [Fibrobacter sp.]|nr:hypothetical protein [Fibrobacter sp.]
MKDNEDFEEKTKKILAGLELAYERMVEFKKSKNSKIVVSQNGKIMLLDPLQTSSK